MARREETLAQFEERLSKQLARERREHNKYYIETGTADPPRIRPKSIVDRNICYTGVRGYEYRHTPDHPDPMLPSIKRDMATIAFNTRSRQCICPDVQADCNTTIKNVQKLTDEILKVDILCGGPIRKKLHDLQIYLHSLQDLVSPTVKSDDDLDMEAHAEWTLGVYKACRALEHHSS